MLPLEKGTGNFSAAMVLNLRCKIAFHEVRDIPEFNFTVKLKQIFNFLLFTEVSILDIKNDPLLPMFYMCSTRYLRTKGLCAVVRVKKH
jgi:hypothetical protein